MDKDASPQRIVSLLPGATDIVAALGLEDHLVGLSAECDAPASVMDRPRVSLTALETHGCEPGSIDSMVRDRLAKGEPIFQADADTLAAIRPDLILSQSLCDVCAATPSTLTRAAIGGATVLSLDGRDLDGLIDDVRMVADAAGIPQRGEQLAARLEQQRQAARRRPRRRPRVLAVEWPDPLFVGGHWIPHMIEEAGGETLGAPGDHSVVIPWCRVRDYAPEVILMLPCGMGLEEGANTLPALTRQPGWADLPAVETGQVYLLDGNRHFSRPGPGPFEGLEILAEILDGSAPDQRPGRWRRARQSELQASSRRAIGPWE